MSDALPVMLGAVSETQFQAQVVGLAKLKGWLVHAERPAWTSKGWRTAIMGDPGFPDLVLSRGIVLIFAELKREKGKLTLEQETWMHALMAARGPTTWVETWRPSDWEKIAERLD